MQRSVEYQFPNIDSQCLNRYVLVKIAIFENKAYIWLSLHIKSFSKSLREMDALHIWKVIICITYIYDISIPKYRLPKFESVRIGRDSYFYKLGIYLAIAPYKKFQQKLARNGCFTHLKGYNMQYVGTYTKYKL